MLSWLSCYLSGRHDYSAWCEPGAIFLRCLHCGRRSSGWSLDVKPLARPAVPPRASVTTVVTLADSGSVDVSRVLPFIRRAS
jgi:hypothetical protein